MNTYIGIDLGTSSVKLLLMRADGVILRTAKRDYAVCCPMPGYSEQNPEDWYQQTVEGLRELLQGESRENVRGIGIAGQMHGLVLLDRQGRVIRPAILWNDGRSAAQTERLNREPGRQKLTEWTANFAFAGFTAPKLLWVWENEPEHYAKIAKVLLPKDYLLYRLSGGFYTDPSDASGTLYWDVHRGRWSEKMLALCGIRREWLPEPVASHSAVGELLPELAAMLGLKRAVLIAGAGDNAAAAVGNGVLSPGDCSISVGTSGTVLIPTGTCIADPSAAVHSFARADGGYMQLGCILSASSCGKWWIENILRTKDYAKEQADICADEPSGLYFLPYLAGERAPYNDPYARGVFFGLRQDTGRTEMTQAVYEGVTFAFRDILESVRARGTDPRSAVLCGGGAKSGFWPQMMADILNLEIHMPRNEEGPSLGSAILAAVGCGEYPDLPAAIANRTASERILVPRQEVSSRYEEAYRFYHSLYPCMRDAFSALYRLP